MSEKENTAAVQQDDILLEVRDLKKYFPIKGGLFNKVVGQVRAVDGISFKLKRGTTMGLVGESGCGKSTAGRTILRLLERTSGEILFNGTDIGTLTKKQLRAIRPKIQIIFQDPYSSLSPRLPVGEIIGEAVREHGIVAKEDYDDYLDTIMSECGLQPFHKDRYPHEFSGGQRQRICIARALALNPSFVVCDEPVSALDVSVRSQVLNLLKDLQEQMNLAYLFISHDLSVVQYICDKVAVMYLGKIVEIANKEDLFTKPLHPYTKALLSAIPVPDIHHKKEEIILEGEVPSPLKPPKGCRFHTRCPYATERCSQEMPQLTDVGGKRKVACLRYQEINS